MGNAERTGGGASTAADEPSSLEHQAAIDRLISAGMKVLTQVARRGGAPAVAAELAHRIDGWAVLLDPSGQLITSAGAGRLHIDDAIAVALGKPVRVRHSGLQTHQVGSDRDLTGYLVTASRSSVMTLNRDLASQAAALFDLVLRTRDPSLTEHLGREALLDTLDRGGSSATRLLRRWGVRNESLTAFAVGSRSRTVDLERMTERWLDELGAEHIFVRVAGRVRGYIADHLAEEIEEYARRYSALGGVGIGLGLGQPAQAESLVRSATQARQALDAALESGERVVRHDRLPTVEAVLSAVPEANLPTLAGLLDGLRDERGEHGTLTCTLRVFLSENGAHRASAARLGIHRQTLLSRIRKAEELTGLSFDRPDDRAAAWLALRVLGTPGQHQPSPA